MRKVSNFDDNNTRHEGHTDYVYALVVFPYKTFISGSADTTIKLWNHHI